MDEPTTHPTQPFVLGRNVLVSLAFTGSMLLLSLISSIVVARLGGPEARGLYSLAQSFYAIIVPLTSVGLGFSTTYHLSTGHRANQLVALNFAVTGATLVLGMAVCLWVLQANDGIPESAMGLAVLTGAAGIWSCTFNWNSRGYLLGVHRVVADNLVPVATMVLFILLTLVLLPIDRTGVLAAVVLGHVGTTLVLVVVQLRAVGRLRWPDRALRKLYLTFGIKASASTFGEFLLLRLDTLLLAVLVELPALGLYAIADQLVNALSMASSVIGRMMFAQSAQDPEGTASRHKLGILIRLLIPVTVTVTVLGLATFWWLIPLLYGEAFVTSYSAFVILAPAIVCRALTSQFAMYLTGQDQQRPVILSGLWGVASEGVLLFALVAAFGWRGAAMAKALAYFVQFAAVYRAYRSLEPPGERLHWLLTRDDVRFLVGWLRARWPR